MFASNDWRTFSDLCERHGRRFRSATGGGRRVFHAAYVSRISGIGDGRKTNRGKFPERVSRTCRKKKKNEIKTYTCIKIKLTSRRRTAMLCFDGVHMRVIITVEICARPKPVCCRPKDVKKKTYALASTLCAILQATSSSPPPPGTERRRGLLGVCNIISHVDFWPAFPRLKRRRKKSPYLPPPHPPD